MNQYEKSIEKHMLKNERDVLNKLKDTYQKGLNDVNAKIKELDIQIRELVKKDPDNESLIRSKIYQRNYQEMLRKQIANNMDYLKDENLKTVNEYLTKMYEDGYLGTIYDIQQQGVPITTPINQELLIKAVTFDTDKIPLSKRLYDNVEDAKKRIIAEISRGISTGASYADIARNVKYSVGVSQRKANMIAQNEGQRVRLEAAQDSALKSKDRGADLVKQWNATLDSKTRPVHRELDNQVAELDEPFKCSLGEVQGPKQFGRASQDINCRCNLVYRVRDMIEDEEERFDNEKKTIIKAKNYEDWKNRYYAQLGKESKDAVRKALESLDITAGMSEGFQNMKRNYDNFISKDIGKDQYDDIMDMLDDSTNTDVKMLYDHYLDEVQVGDSKHKGGAYHRSGHIYWNSNADAKETTLRKKHSTFFHESGHAIDFRLGGNRPILYYSSTYKEGLFPKTIKKEVNALVSSLDSKLKAELNAHKTDLDWLKANGYVSKWDEDILNDFAKKYDSTIDDILNGKTKISKWEKSYLPKYSKGRAYKAIENEIRALTDHQKHSISDIFEGATSGKIQAGWGHGKSYWKSVGVEIEAFAEMLEANISGPESLETLKKYLPESVKVFDEMIKDAVKGLK